MGTPQTDVQHRRALSLVLILCTAATCLCTWELLRIPADQKNAFLFGLSKERLLMLAVFVVLFLGNIAAFLFRSRFSRFLSRQKSRIILKWTSLCALFFLLLPDYRFGKAAAYYTRVRPFLLWLFLTAALLWLYSSCETTGFRDLRETIRNLSAQKKTIFTVLAVLIAGIIFVEISGLGKINEGALWNKNGIPLQSIQLFFSLAVFIPLYKAGLFQKIGGDKKLRHFLLIWACSAAVWSLASFAPHFFAPGPYEPNFEYYPYSDAASYDLAVQTAINGWGFNMRRSILKPTMTYLTFLLRLICGDDYHLAMLIQSALFAILPAIIYLFGSAMGGTGCGYLAALFSLLKEWNALNTREVLTIHSRLTMSEFMMQILFAAFCYAVFRWLQRDGHELRYAALAGGFLALGMYTRFNFIAFLPAAVLYLLIANRKNMRAFMKPLLIFGLTILLTAAPLMIRNNIYTHAPFGYLRGVVIDVLLPQRFDPVTENQETSEALQKSEEDFNTSQITQNNENISSTKNLTLFASMLNHSLHNFIASALTLPMEPEFHDLPHLYTNDGDGLWRDEWEGNFSPRQWLFIGVWILAAAAGMGALLQQHQFAGGSILYFWLVYCGSIGFSRSSGGRYVVPMNWIPMLLLAYFCILMLEKGMLSTDIEGMPEASVNRSVRSVIPVMLAFCLFFTSMVLFEKFMPATVTAAPEGDLAVLKERLADHSEIDWDKVEQQQADELMMIRHGIALYPRFYYFRVGEHSAFGSQSWREYSRLSFYLINKDEQGAAMAEYMLPHTEVISKFPQNSTIRTISCKTDKGYEDVLAVTLDTPDGKVYTYVRDPLPEFSCPVPEPVCTEMEVCH